MPILDVMDSTLECLSQQISTLLNERTGTSDLYIKNLLHPRCHEYTNHRLDQFNASLATTKQISPLIAYWMSTCRAGTIMYQ